MLKEAMRETLQEDLRVCGNMIKGLVELAFDEQFRVGINRESSYLRQLRRIIHCLESESTATLEKLAQLGEDPMPIGVGEN